MQGKAYNWGTTTYGGVAVIYIALAALAPTHFVGYALQVILARHEKPEFTKSRADEEETRKNKTIDLAGNTAKNDFRKCQTPEHRSICGIRGALNCFGAEGAKNIFFVGSRPRWDWALENQKLISENTNLQPSLHLWDSCCSQLRWRRRRQKKLWGGSRLQWDWALEKQKNYFIKCKPSNLAPSVGFVVLSISLASKALEIFFVGFRPQWDWALEKPKNDFQTMHTPNPRSICWIRGALDCFGAVGAQKHFCGLSPSMGLGSRGEFTGRFKNKAVVLAEIFLDMCETQIEIQEKQKEI